MALYDLNDKKQNDIGKKDYWKGFQAFKKTILHETFVSEIESYLNKNESINSLHAGSKIINKIKKSNPEYLNNVDPIQVGSFFGMTLWHYMACDEQSWRFHSLPKDEETSGTYYFKK